MDGGPLLTATIAPRPSFAKLCALTLFALLTSFQTLCWFTFSSASKPGVKAYYGWSNADLDLILNWGPIVGLLTQLPATALLARPGGVEHAMRLSALLMCSCCALRLIPSISSTFREQSPSATLALVHLAQMLNAAAGPLLMSGPTAVSARWFEPAHRGMATAVAYCGSNIGSLMAFAIGPLVISDDASHVPRLLLLELALAASLTLPTLACLPAPPRSASRGGEAHTSTRVVDGSPGPSHPPRPPRACDEIASGLRRARRLVWHGPLIALAIVAGAQAGVASAWQGVLPQQVHLPPSPPFAHLRTPSHTFSHLKGSSHSRCISRHLHPSHTFAHLLTPYGVLPPQVAPPAFDSHTVGLLGVTNSIACLFGNLVGGKIADGLRARLGWCLATAYAGAAVGFALYALSQPSVLSPSPLLPLHSSAWLVAWGSLCGLCQGMADPIAFELAAQMAEQRRRQLPTRAGQDAITSPCEHACEHACEAAASSAVGIGDPSVSDPSHGGYGGDGGTSASGALSAGVVVASWNIASLLLLLLAPALEDGARSVNAAAAIALGVCALVVAGVVRGR